MPLGSFFRPPNRIYMRKKIFKVIAVVLCLEIIFIIYVCISSPSDFEVIFLDVGQGDAILINTPYGQNIVIDGGPSNEILGKVGMHLPIYDKHIDMIIITHPDLDHFLGFIELIKRYDIDYVMLSGAHKPSPEYEFFIRTAIEKEVVFLDAEPFQKIALGEQLYLQILAGGEGESANETSIVIRLSYKDIDFLLTGDAGFETEETLLSKEIASEVLKIGHHGSKYATSSEFLSKVHPAYAVIQAGEGNMHGHPAPETLARLKEHGIIILRTDKDGDIKFESNGAELRLD